MLIAGGAILATRHKVSILLGCRHYVMIQHWIKFVCVCANFSHTWHAHSAVDELSSSDVVLIVAGCAPHFKLESLFRTLFLATVFALTFAK